MSIDAFSQAFGGTDWNQMTTAAQKRAAALPPPPPAHPQTAAKTAAKDEDVLTFGDILDTINPLQHIPLVDVVYRHLTGDTIRPQGEILGGLLYGGLIGGAVATASVLLREATGFDPEEEIVSSLLGDSPSSPSGATTTVAAAAPAPGQTGQAKPVEAAQAKPLQTAQAEPGVAASAPIQLHPAPRAAVGTQTAALPAAAAPVAPAAAPATHASAENHARQSLATANTNALQQLAMDLAAGGQVGDAATTTASTTATDAATAAQGRAGKMPARGTVVANTEMPAGYYAGNRRFGGYARASAPPPASPPATRPAGTANPRTWQSLTQGAPETAQSQAQSQAQAQPQAQANAAGQPQPPATATATTPPAPQVPPPEMISQLMMRNLEKYQAMSRTAGRPTSAANYLN